jgi:hypothetical protein
MTGMDKTEDAEEGRGKEGSSEPESNECKRACDFGRWRAYNWLDCGLFGPVRISSVGFTVVPLTLPESSLLWLLIAGEAPVETMGDAWDPTDSEWSLLDDTLWSEDVAAREL